MKLLYNIPLTPFQGGIRAQFPLVLKAICAWAKGARGMFINETNKNIFLSV